MTIAVSRSVRPGTDLVCKTLAALGVDCVFGIPGSQNVALYDALRRSGLRSVLTTHELAAAFMANGYARASGKVGVVVAIPGPGFAWALAGLAEARLDSVPLLLITGEPARGPGHVFQHQAIDQTAMARPVVKGVVEVTHSENLVSVLAQAYELAREGEPGPVVLQVSAQALSDVGLDIPMPPASRARGDPTRLDEIATLFSAARRPVILAGQGAAGGAAQLRRFVQRWSIPVVTTPAGRGVLPEDHPLALGFDPARGDVAVLNQLLERADCVLALGCKLTHNGTAGFALQLAPNRLIHVDTASAVLEANYPARLAVCARAEDVVTHLEQGCRRETGRRTEWAAAEVLAWRQRLRSPVAGQFPEPSFAGVEGGTAATFFGALRHALPDHGILVTDSGLHQSLTRRHFEVRAPDGLLFPSDFQSMGYGVPAAIGAKLAAPARPVVAVVGDGGLVMAGMELLTAVRERIPLTVIVFHDGKLNQIRLQQLATVGRSHDVELHTPELASFARAIGMAYVRLTGDAEATLGTAIATPGPILVEVLVGDSPAIRALQIRGLARETTRRLLGPRVVGWIKGRLGI